MLGKIGELYSIDKIKKLPKGKTEIDIATDIAIEKFIKKYGYKPVMLAAIQPELDFLHERDDIDIVALPYIIPCHIMLYEVVLSRKPRILKCKRTPKL